MQHLKNSFELFYASLAAQHINYQDNPLIPLQFYAKNYAEFFAQFTLYCTQNNIKACVIIHDGVKKLSALNDAQDIVELFAKYFPIQAYFITLAKASASEFYLQELMQQLRNYPADYAYLALGSGSITDLVKHALYLLQKHEAPFLVVPTATTVSAFSSMLSVIELNGIKKTRLSKHIAASFWIETILQAAPAELIRAGFGDLLAYFVAYADWYLGFELKMFNAYDARGWHLLHAFNIFLKLENFANDTAITYLQRNMALFTQTLAMAGVVMSLCQQSTPLSGYEHAISHSLDFLRISAHKPLALHGIQVALATLHSTKCYEWLCAQKQLQWQPLAVQQKISLNITNMLQKAPIYINNFIRQQAEDTFLQIYKKKFELWIAVQNDVKKIDTNWSEIKINLKKTLLSSAELQNILRKILLATNPQMLEPSINVEEYHWAIDFSPFIRERFCLGDLLLWLNPMTSVNY